MEFKGTKGEWTLNHDGSIIDEEGTEIIDIFIITEEDEANALLISKAPEMLEKLNQLHCLMEYLDEWQEERKSIKQLIKQATEL